MNMFARARAHIVPIPQPFFMDKIFFFLNLKSKMKLFVINISAKKVVNALMLLKLYFLWVCHLARIYAETVPFRKISTPGN